MSTILTQACSLSSALRRFGKGPKANGYVPPVGVVTLQDYVETELKDEFQLTTKMRPKFTCNRANLEALFKSIYSPRMTYHGAREVLQLHFLVLISLIQITRPGEILTTTHYRENEFGMVWDDVELVITSGEGKECDVGAKVTITNMKRHKNDKSTFKSKLFYFEPDPKFDALSLLLALAVADDVFDSQFSLLQLMQLKSIDVERNFGGMLIIKAKKEKREEPILKRYVVRHGEYQLDNDASMSAERARLLLRSAGEGAGFTKNLTFYDFRRTGADLINAPGVATAADITLAMGHTPGSSVFADAYVSRTSFIDVQSLIAGRIPDRKRLQVGEGIPMLAPLADVDIDPTTRSLDIHNDYNVQTARSSYNELRTRLISKHGSLAAARRQASDPDVAAFSAAEVELLNAQRDAERRVESRASDAPQEALLVQALRTVATDPGSSREDGMLDDKSTSVVAPVPPSETENAHASSSREPVPDERSTGLRMVKPEPYSFSLAGLDFDPLDILENETKTISAGARLAARAAQLNCTNSCLGPDLVDSVDDKDKRPDRPVADTSARPFKNAIVNVIAPVLTAMSRLSDTDNQRERVSNVLSALAMPVAARGQFELEPDGMCGICGDIVSSPTSEHSAHVHDCVRQQLIQRYQLAALEEVGSVCPFPDCAFNLDEPAEVEFAHFASHVGQEPVCSICNIACETVADLLQHLESAHAVLCVGHAGYQENAFFCDECEEWFIGAVRLDDHTAIHLPSAAEPYNDDYAINDDSGYPDRSVSHET